MFLLCFLGINVTFLVNTKICPLCRSMGHPQPLLSWYLQKEEQALAVNNRGASLQHSDGCTCRRHLLGKLVAPQYHHRAPGNRVWQGRLRIAPVFQCKFLFYPAPYVCIHRYFSFSVPPQARCPLLSHGTRSFLLYCRWTISLWAWRGSRWVLPPILLSHKAKAPVYWEWSSLPYCSRAQRIVSKLMWGDCN